MEREGRGGVRDGACNNLTEGPCRGGDHSHPELRLMSDPVPGHKVGGVRVGWACWGSLHTRQSQSPPFLVSLGFHKQFCH